MAKLGAYYSLCPIIDHHSLLGISPDKEIGRLLVGLAKNIAVKYRLSDQKQLESWRTKEKFTSPIIYDKQQDSYVAVFNQSYIRLWTGQEGSIDKLRKYKFGKHIQTLISVKEKCFVLFRNGTIIPLDKALEQRKVLILKDVINSESEYIKDVLYNFSDEDVCIGLIVSSLSGDNHQLFWTKFTSSGDQTPIQKVTLHREGFLLTGQVFRVAKSGVHLLTLWNDGHMYSLSLNDLEESTLPGDLHAVVESICCENSVSMVFLDENYIAMYGGDCNEEGASLVIYNVQFKVTQSKQNFKMFTMGAKLWAIDSNLYLPVGQNFAVIPFVLDAEQLAALVGSHKAIEIDSDISIVHHVQTVNWEEGSKPSKNTNKTNKIAEPLHRKIADHLAQGLPEGLIIEQLLPDFAESKDVLCLSQCIEYFSDVPENCLAKLLKIVVNLNRKIFKKCSNSQVEGFPPEMQPLERSNLIDLILIKPVSDVLILNHLRSELELSDVLTLLEYLCFLLSDEGHSLPKLDFIETEAKVVNWGCVLLDANYQKFLLSDDDRVKQVINRFQNLVKNEVESLEQLQEVAPMLIELWRGPGLKVLHEGGVGYSIEELSLY